MNEFAYNGFDVKPGGNSRQVSLIAKRNLKPACRCQCTSGRIFEGRDRASVLRAIDSEGEEAFRWTFIPKGVVIELSTYYVTERSFNILTDKMKQLIDAYSIREEKFAAKRLEAQLAPPVKGAVSAFQIEIFYGELKEEGSMHDAY